MDCSSHLSRSIEVAIGTNQHGTNQHDCLGVHPHGRVEASLTNISFPGVGRVIGEEFG